MKVAWFTPLSTDSAIGRASAGIASELSALCEVEVCYFDSGPVRHLNVPSKRFIDAASVSARTLSRYDFVFYNFGNNLPFHREIYLLSRRHAGICILHDFVMHHFFAAYYLEELRDPATLADLMVHLYGEPGRLATGKRIWETSQVRDFFVRRGYPRSHRRRHAFGIFQAARRTGLSGPGSSHPASLRCGPSPQR